LEKTTGKIYREESDLKRQRSDRANVPDIEAFERGDRHAWRFIAGCVNRNLPNADAAPAARAAMNPATESSKTTHSDGSTFRSSAAFRYG
jgi:hypothetical protein